MFLCFLYVKPSLYLFRGSLPSSFGGINCLSQAGIGLMIPEFCAVLAVLFIEQRSKVDGIGRLLIYGSEYSMFIIKVYFYTRCTA